MDFGWSHGSLFSQITANTLDTKWHKARVCPQMHAQQQLCDMYVITK